MPDDDKGGSGSGTGGAASAAQAGAGAAGAGADSIKNKIAKMSMDERTARLEELETIIVPRKDALITELTQKLDEINGVVESDQKAKLIGEILARSSFKMDELVGKSVEDLQNIRATLDQAMPPKVNSVRYGVQGADLSDREKGLTVGDLSIVTAQQRKAKS